MSWRGMGNIETATTDEALNKFGFQVAVNTTEVTVADVLAVQTYPSAATVVKVSSSSSADTDLPIQIYGLDGDLNEINETVTTDGADGQTAVTSTKEFYRVFRAINRGTSNNAGIVYVGTGSVASGVPATKYAAISIGQNQTLMAAWTVPNDKTFYLGRISWSVGGSAKSGTLRLVARPSGEVFQTKEKQVLTQASDTLIFDPPQTFAAGTDIEVRATSGSGDIEVSAGFGGVVKDRKAT